jgi:hypothetical protein
MPSRPEDPVLVSSRREAVVVFLIWLAACLYTVGFSYAFGYGRDPATLRFILGMPDWVFGGIFIPWTVCTVLSYIVARYVIADDDLGEEMPEESLDSVTSVEIVSKSGASPHWEARDD